MLDWVEKLLAVQEIDLRIDRLREQIASVPVEQEKHRQMLHVDETAMAQEQEALREAEKALKRIEIDADGIRAKKTDFQTKTSMIKSNEEYRAALHQIELCDRQVRDLEDRELEVMEKIEATRARLRAAKDRAAAAAKRVAELHADLERRRLDSQAEADSLLEQRTRMIGEVTPEMARKYERLRGSQARMNSHDQRALVPVRDQVCCDRCRMNVTAQVRMNARKGVAGLACEHCGSLLYWED